MVSGGRGHKEFLRGDLCTFCLWMELDALMCCRRDGDDFLATTEAVIRIQTEEGKPQEEDEEKIHRLFKRSCYKFGERESAENRK